MIGTVVSREDYLVPKAGGVFNAEEYDAHPERYRSTFAEKVFITECRPWFYYVKCLELYTCIVWNYSYFYVIWLVYKMKTKLFWAKKILIIILKAAYTACLICFLCTDRPLHVCPGEWDLLGPQCATPSHLWWCKESSKDNEEIKCLWRMPWPSTQITGNLWYFCWLWCKHFESSEVAG